jgi:hypothetical protein
LLFADEPRTEKTGTAMRWRAKTKADTLREAVSELGKGEFHRVRIVRYDPSSGEADEDVLTGE